MIEMQNLSFAYKKTSVFEALNIEFKSGNIYGLLGENGVGKTTLLKIISGLLFPKQGFVFVLGYEPKKREEKFLEKIFFLPDEFITPKEVAEKWAKQMGAFYPTYKHDTFLECMREFEVDPKKRLNEMSFGQRKKALVSLCMACHTELLLMDEPTNGMDIPSKSVFRKLLVRFSSENQCVIISTHQVRDLENLIDPIVIMTNTDILLNASVEEIERRLKFDFCMKDDETALYTEQTPQGLYAVKVNDDGTNSKMNIEMLFNAVLRNKTQIKQIFNQVNKN